MTVILSPVIGNGGKKSGAVLGLLGGGQLAQMLTEVATRAGVGQVIVLDRDPRCPASLVGAEVIVGGIDVDAALGEIARRSERLGFENEFVDCDRLARTGARFVPALAVIRRLQDKLEQKRLLEELGIPNAPYLCWPALEPASAWVARMSAHFGESGTVLKWARMGYDGKGVFLLSSRLDSGMLAEAAEFCSGARARGIQVYAERRVRFRRELAVVACRAEAGEFRAYPLVVSEQRSGICLRVQGPATALGVSPRLETEAHAAVRAVGERVGLVGAFALEFFESGNGELLVNEIAPRVHNTGHYTQDAAETSQFENHLRALFGRELGSVKTAPAFAMLNLLGPEGLVREDGAPPSAVPGVFVHWYGKRDIRPGRKLGHLNARVGSVAELSGAVTALERVRDEWEAALRAGK